MTMPQFKNSRDPKTAKYAIHYGHPVAYAKRRLIFATVDGVATTVTGIDESRGQRLSKQMNAWAEELGLQTTQPKGWTDSDGRMYWEISITSTGEFCASGCVGLDRRTICIQDADRVKSMLIEAAGETGML